MNRTSRWNGCPERPDRAAQAAFATIESRKSSRSPSHAQSIVLYLRRTLNWRRERDSVASIRVLSMTFANSESLNPRNRRESPGAGAKRAHLIRRAFRLTDRDPCRFRSTWELHRKQNWPTSLNPHANQHLAPAAYLRNPRPMTPAPISGSEHAAIRPTPYAKCLLPWRTTPVEWPPRKASSGWAQEAASGGWSKQMARSTHTT